MITKERALMLDNILLACIRESDSAIFHVDDWDEQREIDESIQYLSGKEYLKVYSSGRSSPNVRITLEGKLFYESGGFLKRIEQKEEELNRQRKYEEVAHKVNEKALQAAKRQPYLIIWGIITTLATIVLTYLQVRG